MVQNSKVMVYMELHYTLNELFWCRSEEDEMMCYVGCQRFDVDVFWKGMMLF